jgi:hypothetical protein
LILNTTEQIYKLQTWEESWISKLGLIRLGY